MTYSETFLKRIETSSSKKPTIPDYELRNPIDAEVFVTGIVLIPNSYFQLKGKAVVTVNGVVVFDESDSAAFRDTDEVPIALTQKMLGRSQKIEVFVWNGIDTDVVGLTVNIKLSQNQDETFAAARAANRQAQKQAYSPPTTLFPNQARQPNTTETKLVDLDGYPKMLILISKTTTQLPTAQGGDTMIADGDLFTLGVEAQVTDTVNFSHFSTVDFGSIAIRRAAAKWRISQDFGSAITPQLQVSDDGVNWTVAVTGGSQSGIGDYFISDTVDRSFRYLRIGFKKTGGINSIYRRVYELYDKSQFGGSGSLSFEVLDSESGQWIPYITAAELGTITGGGNVAVLVGDVTESGVNRFNRSLPSTQTHFRAKYTIDANGGLTNSVSIIRMA